MNPIAYHNAVAALLQAQEHAFKDYEARLAALTARAEAAEKALAQASIPQPLQ